MKAFVSPHRVIRARFEGGDSVRFEIGRIIPCETCGHGADSHMSKRRCTEDACGCVAYVGRREYEQHDTDNAVGAMCLFLLKGGATVVEVLDPPHNYHDAEDIIGAVMRGLEAIGVTIAAPWWKPNGAAECRAVRAGHQDPVADMVAPSDERVQHVLDSKRDTIAAVTAPTVGPDGLWPYQRDGISSLRQAAQDPAGRVAGIDPGTARIAVVVADPPRYIAHKVFHIGAVERVRGSKRNRHVFTDDDVRGVCAGVCMFLRQHGVSRAVVESSNGGLFNNAAEAMRANHVGGAILGYLLGQGLAVTRISESTWYAAIVKGKRSKRYSADPKLHAALVAGYGGTWPTTTSEDVRDAGGIVLGSLAPKKAKPPPKLSPPKRTGEKRAAKRLEKRKASGCTCKGRSQHRIGCPARVKR